MGAEVVVALLSLAGTTIGSIAGIMASNRLTTYRIDQLEKKVDKHNGLIERVALIEQTDKAQWRKIDEINEELKKVEDDGK